MFASKQSRSQNSPSAARARTQSGRSSDASVAQGGLQEPSSELLAPGPVYRWDFSRLALHVPSLGFVQRKLSGNLAIGEPGDVFEREADSVAARVMRMQVGAGGVPASTAPVGIQRKCACGGSCSKCRSGEHVDDREHDETHDHASSDHETAPVPVQRKVTASGALSTSGDAAHATVPSIVQDVLRLPGRPLDASVRGFMEPRFGRSFRDVRVHTGSMAASSAEAIFARAYTGGHHIVFGQGQYRPDTAEGRQLLAHELTHVLQQRGGSLAIQREPDKKWANDESAARYRGKILADRIHKHGKVSKDVEAKFREELDFFKGQARDTYKGIVSSAVRDVVETDYSVEEGAEATAPAPAKPTPAPPPPEKPKQCSRLPDAGSGKKCKFYIYDSTLDDALGETWKDAAYADAMFRPATYVVPSGNNFEQLLENLINGYAEKDCDCTDEVQFWSHGSSGNGGFISNAKDGAEELTTKVLSIPDVDKFGDDRSTPGYQEWYAKLSVLQRRLVLLRRTMCDSNSTIYYRSCQAFKGAKGKEFAKASSEFFRCDVSGHTKSIGLSQPGKHTLSPCEEPDWSDEEGADEESKKDKHKLQHVKPK